MDSVFQVIDRGTSSIKWTGPMTDESVENMDIELTETLIFKLKKSDTDFVVGEPAWQSAVDPALNHFRSSLMGGITTQQKKFVPNKSVLSNMTDGIIAQGSGVETLIIPISEKCNKNYELKELERHFEVFGMSRVGRPRVSSCTLAAMGTFDGMVLDAGHQSVEIESVLEGYANVQNSQLSFRGGHYMTRVLMDRIEDQQGTFYADDNMVARQAIDRLKRKYAAFKEPSENQRPRKPVQAKLPDGYSICLTQEDLHNCCQSIIARTGDLDLASSENALPEDIMDHIWRLPLDVRLDQLCNKVVLTGGMALTPGLKGVLEAELERLYQSKTNKHQRVSLTVPPDPLRSTVTGAVLLALTTPLEGDPASSMWLSREQYLENGPERSAFLS